MNKNKTQQLSLILSVLILSFLTAYWILAWDEPGSSPPLGNVATPINTGSTAQTKSGALTITSLTADSASNDKILLKGTQASPHTIWLGDSKGVRFWDNTNGELMSISNTGVVSIPELISCDTIDTDATGKMSCGADAGTGGVQGSGTTNYVSKFTDTGTIGNSQIFDDGANVGIGTATPGAKLDIADAGTVAGAQFLRVGDDTFFTDIDVANTLGIYGIQDSTQGNIKLGSGGPVLSGASGNLTLSGDLTVSGGNINLDDIANAQNSKIDWYATDNNTGSVQYTTSDRWEWSNGDFYITNTVPTTWIYSDNIYLGDSSGDTIHVRGNVMKGDSWYLENNGLRLGSQSSPGGWELYVDGEVYVQDYLRADGGIHVGGSSDPGTDNLIVDGDIAATSNSFTDCAWECAGGDYQAGTFTNICDSGKIATGIRTIKALRDVLFIQSYYVYNVCVYCCEL